MVAVVAIAAIVALTSVGSKLGVAPPLVLILVGIGISLLPIMGEIRVPGDVILIGVLPPLLYASAVSVPVVEFRRDLVAVGGLAVVLVVGTALALGAALHLFLPAVPFTICVALGAIISPTDAVATTIVKRLGVPSRIVTMLDGESLLNDATALVLLRATTAGTAAGLSFVDISLEFVTSAVIATVVGAVVGWVAVRVRQYVHNPAANTAVSFIIPFVAYAPAEFMEASGLVATVVAGLVSNQLAPHRLAAQHRINESANWHTAEYLLEGAVFLLMGLQLKALLHDASDEGDSLWLALGLGVMCIVGAVVVRAAFVALLGLVLNRITRRKAKVKERWETVGDALGVDLEKPDTWSTGDISAVRLAAQSGFPGVGQDIDRRRQQAVDRLRSGPLGRPVSDAQRSRRVERLKTGVQRYIADVNYLLREPLGLQEGTLLVWAGMRGVVTLAAAQTLSGRVAHDNLLILIAFTVATGSMLIQGGTLGWVAKALKLAGRDTVPEGEQHALDHDLGEAALHALNDPELRQKSGAPYDPRIIALITLRLHMTRLDDLAQARTTISADKATVAAVEEETAEEIVHDVSELVDPEITLGPGSAATPVDPEAALKAPCGAHDQANPLAQVVERARQRLVGDAEDENDTDEEALDTADRKRQHRELRLVALHAMREALLEARALGVYSHKTLSSALRVIDADEVGLELRAESLED
jgi:CPA1 family monovalent cation:H+ antiporter